MSRVLSNRLCSVSITTLPSRSQDCVRYEYLAGSDSCAFERCVVLSSRYRFHCHHPSERERAEFGDTVMPPSPLCFRLRGGHQKTRSGRYHTSVFLLRPASLAETMHGGLLPLHRSGTAQVSTRDCAWSSSLGSSPSTLLGRSQAGPETSLRAETDRYPQTRR